jgi:Cu2+-containing amine oxidase
MLQAAEPQLNQGLASLHHTLTGFMKWSFAATQHKDNEQQSSSIYGQARLSNPSTSVTDYVNGENIRNKDIVVWVNSGLYHIPTSEDAPVTATTGNMLSFALLPFNWANENPATDMADMIQIETATRDTAIPQVKQAMTRCQPTFQNVKFLTDGWEEA